MTERLSSRMPWGALPQALVRAIEEALGSPITSAVSQPAGFSPGSADRVVTATGRRAFVKAASRSRDPGAHALHRRERDVMLSLPDAAPAPRRVAAINEGEWTALVIDDIEGRHPDEAEKPADLDAVLDALERLPDAASMTLPRLSGELAAHADGWRRLREDGATGTVPGLAKDGALLEELAREAGPAVRGSRLVHFDCRADNVLIGAEGDAVIIDWPWACVGAPWFDALTYLLDMRRRLGPGDIDDAVASHPIFRGALPRQIDAALAGLAGGFFDAARLPAPPNMPTIRAFQFDEGVAALGWLRERLAARDSHSAASGQSS